MGKSVVVFDTNTGVNFTRKKRKMIGNGESKPEVKQFNPAKSAADDSYDAIRMYPLVGVSISDRTSVTSWKLFHLYMPSQGSTAYQRVGNSIFLKCFRLKGYITIRGRIATAVRWRLKLVKFVGNGIASGVGAAAQTNTYLQLFRNHEAYPTDTSSSADYLHDITRHNFYKTIKLYPKTYDWHSKVIASGVLPGVKNIFNYSTNTSLGTNSQYTFGRSLNLSNMNTGLREFEKVHIPLDIMVTLNDRVTWRTVNGVTAVMTNYYLALEEDLGAGIHIAPPTGTGSSIDGADWYYTNSTNDAVAEFNFFIRGYFTDD